MSTKVQQQHAKSKRRIERRLDKTKFDDSSPVLSGANIHYEVSDRTRAISAGGLGMIHQMVGRLGLTETINRRVPLLKIYLPYSESDHVLNMAYNIMAGGTCLDHLELRRNDEVYLEALGVQRIPDPTTAGDFCRRFDKAAIDQLQEAINEIRIKVWKQQPDSFFDEAVIDGDGTMVTTTGECKRGMDINYEGEWGYHPLMISLANTGEPLYIVNRSGNRPSYEGAAEYFDLSVRLCRGAGFRRVRLRGDTDFSQTTHLDRWDDGNVTFVFGIDAMANLYEKAENLPKTAWKVLSRKPGLQEKPQSRARPLNVKQQVVESREFKDIRLVVEHVAEFSYRPVACDRDYRVVVVWKSLEVHQGQRKLFDDAKAFFYITNDWDSSPEQIVFEANQRCNQENLIEQQKNGVHAFTAPLDNLNSNWAYMVIASLAWSFKAWSALLLPVNGRWQEKHAEEKRQLLRMDFSTYRNAIINIPAQIVRTGRKIVYRFLAWNRWQGVFFRLFNHLKKAEHW